MRAVRRALRIAGRVALVLLVILAVAVAAITARVVWYYGYEIGIPDHHRLAGAASRPVCADGKRTFISLADTPTIVRNAVLAAQDADFYARPPYNPLSAIAIALVFEQAPSVSHISFAMARCLISTNPQCCRQNIDWQVITAIVLHRLEANLSRDVLLETYLNETFMGRGSSGVVAAADAYFGKQLADLSLGEIAFLAALPRAPSYISKTLERGTERRNVVHGFHLPSATSRGDKCVSADTTWAKTHNRHCGTGKAQADHQ
jgi:membrane carboxypeptidase/penicillin-binding protein